MSTPYLPDSHHPGLLLHMTGSGSGLQLYVKDMTRAMGDLCRPKYGEALVGTDLCQRDDLDRQVLDEWVEFLVRARDMPYIGTYVEEEEGSTGGYMLQFLPLLDDWRVTEVRFYRQGAWGVIRLIPPGQFEEKTLLRQLTILSNIRRMHCYSSNKGHWTIDRASHTIFLSGAFARMLGIAGNAVVIPLGRFLDRIHREDVGALVQALDNARLTSLISRCTAAHRTVHLFSSLTPIRGEAGGLVRIFGMSEDVTDREAEKTDLRRSATRFRRFVENTGDVYATVSKGVYTYLSPNLAQLSGKDSATLLGTRVGELPIDTPNLQKIRRKIRGAIAAGASCRFRSRVILPSGARRWYQFSVIPVTGPGGELLETVGIGQDITGEKERQEELEHRSTHDELTGLYNRQTFWKLLEKHQREARDCCLVLLDINGLGLVNNILGHHKGDLMLGEVADILRQTFPRRRHIARIGGDEFGVIAHGTDLDHLEKTCQRIARFCAQTGDRLLPVSVAWGFACLQEADGVQELYRLTENRLLANKLLQHRSAHNQTLRALEEALRVRNVETARHLARMETMVRSMGDRLHLATHDLNRLRLLASLHDVGKLGIPDKVINKPGPLNEEERQIMQTHSEIGYRIVLQSPELSAIAQEVLCHHERWDGTGYPLGKRGEEIPLLAQIIAVVDAYDVMVSRRVYKEPMPHQAALEELQRCSGTQFSPAVVALFLECFAREEPA